MKHTLLATTALVAMTGAAAAEISFSGSARVGFRTTEGAAAVAAVAIGTVYGKTTAAQIASYDQFGKSSGTTGIFTKDEFNATDTAYVLPAAGGSATATDIANLKTMIANAQNVLGGTHSGSTAAVTANLLFADTAAERTQLTTDIATMQTILAALDFSAAVAAKAKVADTTDAKNRVRISFSGSGETDGGLTYGFSARADQSNTSTGGSQYISGAFGKISMGDLDGGDEQLVGNLSGVGVTGAGSYENFGYQSSAHNIGYSVSMAGVSFAATTDLVRGADATKTGSNSAMGIKWSGDMGGATVGIALGSSKMGTVSEDSVSASVSMGGLSIMAVSHNNDNGPDVAAVTGTSQTFGASSVAFKAGTAAVAKPDTDTTGLSISYAMDAMSVTAFTRTESTSGVADKDYSGVGFTYDLGGATLKAGFVDANDISIMDVGVSFSF
jgi:outer membrane protein OmpU